MKQFLVIAVLIAGARGLSCYCDTKNLTAFCGAPPTCKGSIINDVCGCCKACAKVKGETCGGPWDMSGKCDTGLTCRKEGTAPKPIDNNVESPTTPKIFYVLDFNARGTCVPSDTGESDD